MIQLEGIEAVDYTRFSHSIDRDTESDSIENQHSLIERYCKDHNINLVAKYEDDGYSGTNFNRPAFQQLINDIESGKVKCIITKDFSRLGRDYIGMGEYLERYFPMKKVRYISINDNYDSFSDVDDDFLPFRFLLNDRYPKDISKKVKSVKHTQQLEGKWIGSCTPYGYTKEYNKKEHYTLIIVEEEAKVVRIIFELFLKGYGTYQIANYLTDHHYPTPMIARNKRIHPRAILPEVWDKTTVRRILTNRAYIGDTVQHKFTKPNYKIQKIERVPEKDWIIIRHTHEPIIEENVFWQVQEMLAKKTNRNYSKSQPREYLLSGLLYCEDCGTRMSTTYNKRTGLTYLMCNSYKKYSKYGYCTSHTYNYETLENYVLSSLKTKLANLKNDNQDLLEEIRKNCKDPKKMIANNLNQYKKKLDFLYSKIDQLYNDKVNNIITIETFQHLYSKAQEEIDTTKDKLKELMKEQENISSNSSTDECIRALEELLNVEKPTKALLNKLIDKITIDESKNIKIIYKFKELEQ